MKMKQTEIGLIPDDWEVKEIKDFADVTTGDKNTQDAEKKMVNIRSMFARQL